MIERKSFLLFLLLEFFGFFLILKSNLYVSYKNKDFFTEISGRYNNKIHRITNYFELAQTNKLLQEENTRIKNLQINKLPDSISSMSWKHYQLTPAIIITNQFQFANNHVILDKGTQDSIKPGMGVLGTKGVIGTVIKVSPHYAAVLSILNNKTSISVKPKTSGHFGFLRWDGKSPETLIVEDIPVDALINISDTLVTSGNSNIFPKGIPVGIVTDIKKLKGSKNYLLMVRPVENLTNLNVAYILHNKYQNEYINLKDSLDEN
jgi:rod shape-determining protein MreC